ncbi:Peptidoglycan/LPS O-acetylase OafA/YrhL, contains acyltransferase and SGNH-hydrolase domains [Promicromonospora umidemergens]|uniref:Acyltransferase family protein n=1 Tax=Promicromonospora umidemergens TaxID=629679 RepID=A0ABP8Y9B7_9MICO|nr:acyltransferase family protein [Promicromonospora umidemergens]MCP2284665.1 Peptidoglycan/LPS O-acetylase OafA/YrhL, contains acyltransferase and SGNH-hydrolase domains [Promicromonospora umidemergens]
MAEPRIGAVDGLRGLALILVVAFHLFGQGRVSGGVDVFLLLSGYFATGTLFRRAEAGSLRLAAHYARTLARLLPAALVVLTAVTIALLTLAPRMSWSAGLREIGASATFWENWELVHASLAYGAAGPGTSPLQHFWSLSVQGQFFAVWPLVVLGLVAGSRRLGRHRGTRPTTGASSPAVLLAAVTGVATAASFAGALWLVTVDQPVAYFSTFTRFWEIGAGALLALALRARVPRQGPLRDVLGWVGLALVVGSGFLVDGANVFPGAWALVPVSGAALVLIATASVPAGQRTPAAAPARGVERLLDSAPLLFGARISYALYLWHWPILIFWLLTTDTRQVGPMAAGTILTASTVLAWLTTRYVAEPLLTRVTDRLSARRAAAPDLAPRGDDVGHRAATTPSGRRTLAALAGAAVLVLCSTQVAAAGHDATVRHDIAALLVPSPDHPGAAALAPDAPPADTQPGAPFRPATWVAYDDHPDRPDCAQDGDRAEVLECTVVSPADPTDPTAVVYLAGASHEQQYEEAFVALAHEHGWELREMIKHGCRLATSGEGSVAHRSACATWNEGALDALVAARPDVVVVVGTRTHEDGAPEEVLPGQAEAWRTLDDAGITVVTIRDNPRFEWFVPECMVDAVSPEVCGRPRAEQLADVSPVTTAPGVPGTAVHLDLTDSICGPVRCDPVVGNVLVYRDDDHLTNTYVRTLGPFLGNQLRQAVPSLFDGGTASGQRTAGTITTAHRIDRSAPAGPAGRRQ